MIKETKLTQFYTGQRHNIVTILQAKDTKLRQI